MTGAQLDSFLSSSDLADWEKLELSDASDKTKYYSERAIWKEIQEAHRIYGAWEIYFLKNAIFMPTSIQTKFSDLNGVIKGALVEWRISKEEGGLKYSEMTDLRKLMSEGQTLRTELEAEIHKRLWISDRGERTNQ